MATADGQLARLAYHVDRHLGGAVSGAVAAHHRRRLRRSGWEGALDADGGSWARGTPPREGCVLEVLIDGAEALPRIAAELEGATSHVHLTGWHFTPGFALTRNDAPTILRNLLGALSTRIDVRVLAWAGAPLPLFRPSRVAVRRMRDRLCEGTRIECALDSKERPLHCHHEKTIVIDDRVAFVGGIDLTAESGDRFDITVHLRAADVGWHDLSDRLEGPAVADVAEHFRMRWHEVTGRAPSGARRSTGGGHEDPDRPDRARADLLGGATRRLRDPRVVCPRAA